MFDVGAITARLELSIAGWQKSVEAVKADQTSLSGLVKGYEDQIKSLGKTFTVAGAAITASLGAMVKKTADYGDEMDEMSQRTGASVELLTGLDGALRKNGASAQDLAVGMKFLSGKMVDANNGNKDAIKLFEDLGISIHDTSTGELRPMTDVLFDVATRFKGMENGAVKTTAAVDLLGRGGMSLIPTLNLGADGLKREADQASRLGKVLTAEAAKACSDFNDSLVDLRGGLQGVGIQIGTVLMPMAKELVEKVTGIVIKVREWAAEHPELASGLSKVAFSAGGLMMGLGPMLYMLPGLVKGWQMLTGALNLSTAALGMSVLGLGAVAAAAAVTYEIVTRLTEAKNRATDADYQAFESNQKLGQKLREVTDAAGLTRAEFHQLSLKYDDNNAAMAIAIKRGTEGKTLQEALAKVGKEHAAAIDEQRKKMAEADPVTRALQEAMSKLGKETKTLAEQLGITFRSETEDRIKKLNEALLLYRGKLTYDEIKRIYEEINKLTTSMEGLKGPVIDVDKAIRTLIDGLDAFSLTGKEVTDAVNAEFKDLRDEMQADFEKLLTKDIPDWMFNLWTPAEETTAVFKTCADAIAGGFAIAFGNIALYAGNLGAALVTIVHGMTMSFSEFLIDLDSKSAAVFSGFSKSANNAAISAALSFAGLWLDILAGMLNSEREWDAYWDEIEREAYLAGETIYNAIWRGQLQDPNAPGWRPGEPSSGHVPREVNPSLPDQIRPAPGNPHYAAGGIAWIPQWASLGERKPEIIGGLDDYLAGRPLAGIPQPGPGGRRGPGAGGPVVNNYHISIQAIDGPSVERLFKTQGREIIDEMFRQNKGGLTRNVNRYLEAMA